MSVVTIYNADGTVNTTGCTATVGNSSDTMVGNAIDGLMSTFGDEPVSSDEHRQGMLAAITTSVIASSMFTRNRVAAGKPPLLKFLF